MLAERMRMLYICILQQIHGIRDAVLFYLARGMKVISNVCSSLSQIAL